MRRVAAIILVLIAVPCHAEDVTVPDVTWADTGSKVIELLRGAGLRAAFAPPQPAPKPELEGVIVQNPPAGSRAARGSAVVVMKYGKPRRQGAPPARVDETGEQKLFGTTPSAPPTGAEVTGDGVCNTSAGPFGCTGRFAGSVVINNRGRNDVVLFLNADGSAQLNTSNASIPGRIDASGRAVFETTTSITELHLQKVPASGGAWKAAGSGTYSGLGDYAGRFTGTYTFP